MTEQDRLPQQEAETYYAAFRHPDGRWYRLWMTRTQPKTARGHPWHVHASYDLQGTTEPAAEGDWYMADYGVSNWDFDSYEEALEQFFERFRQRIDHGYVIVHTNLSSSSEV